MASFSICSHPLQQGRKFYHLMVVQKLYIKHYPEINTSNVKQISLENLRTFSAHLAALLYYLLPIFVSRFLSILILHLLYGANFTLGSVKKALNT